VFVAKSVPVATIGWVVTSGESKSRVVVFVHHLFAGCQTLDHVFLIRILLLQLKLQ
jgi:hypothetical protein